MAGAGPADYSGAQSKRTLITTWHRVPGREGSGRANYFEGNVQNAHPPITGSRHGKKTRSTPLGYMTTNALGNGNLRHGNFAIGQHALRSPYLQECSSTERADYIVRNICDFGIIHA